MLCATREVATTSSIQVVQDKSETERSQPHCTQADDRRATVNRSLESIAMKNSQRGDEDSLGKLVPDVVHQEFKHTLEHPTGTDVTEFDGTPENPEGMDGREIEFESIRHQGTDPKRIKNGSGTTENTQRDDCDTNGQFDDTWHLHGRKVLELVVMIDKTRDCSTCATQLPFKVEQTHKDRGLVGSVVINTECLINTACYKDVRKISSAIIFL
ncbi:hypothetical protein scyTo_0018322 [Scyliorhinus torazame]|uniref:Uncharacterized protein n=1 Tax=Scyliorhinus torazame TaxID=75743 RepID=A0A401PT28_SCYTO|nr:hypothetical protein [Scyliorhinus torazame]